MFVLAKHWVRLNGRYKVLRRWCQCHTLKCCSVVISITIHAVLLFSWSVVDIYTCQMLHHDHLYIKVLISKNESCNSILQSWCMQQYPVNCMLTVVIAVYSVLHFHVSLCQCSRLSVYLGFVPAWSVVYLYVYTI